MALEAIKIAEKKKAKPREKVDSAGRAIGAGLGYGVLGGALLNGAEIKKGFSAKKNPISAGKHYADEFKKNKIAREDYARPIGKRLNEKVKQAKDNKEKIKLHAEAAEEMKGFKPKKGLAYSDTLKESAGKRIARAAKPLKTGAKIALGVGGLTAVSELASGWNRKVD